jgi:hypothetical protein
MVLPMRPFFVIGLGAVAGCLAVSSVALASRPDPVDYPLRVHILRFTSQPRHTREAKSLSDTPDYIDGLGVADLFENGEPSGFQFSYSCMGGLKASGGYANYPARWKEKGKTLEILQPETGKPWNLKTCDLQAEMRPGLAFYWKNGGVAEEPAGVLKAWMAEHQYDPEKDKDQPIMAPGESAVSAKGESQVAEPD